MRSFLKLVVMILAIATFASVAAAQGGPSPTPGGLTVSISPENAPAAPATLRSLIGSGLMPVRR